VTNPRLHHHCYDCRQEREVQTRYQHGARLLCDDCSSKRGAGRVSTDTGVPCAQNRQWLEAELDALFADDLPTERRT
jgi:hypothetical protein